MLGECLNLKRATSYFSSSRAKLITPCLRKLACQNESDLSNGLKNWKICHSNLHTTSKRAPRTYKAWRVLCAKQPTPDRKSCSVRGYLSASKIGVPSTNLWFIVIHGGVEIWDLQNWHEVKMVISK